MPVTFVALIRLPWSFSLFIIYLTSCVNKAVAVFAKLREVRELEKLLIQDKDRKEQIAQIGENIEVKPTDNFPNFA